MEFGASLIAFHLLLCPCIFILAEDYWHISSSPYINVFYRTDAIAVSNLWQNSLYTSGCVVKHACFIIFLLSQNLGQVFSEILARTFLNSCFVS